MKVIYNIIIVMLVVFSCGEAPEKVNKSVLLSEIFPFEETGLKAITSVINPQRETTSILYGNDCALESLKTPGLSIKGQKTLVLVTWKQRDDPNWFGAKSPSDFLMLEILKTNEDFSQIEKVSYKMVKSKNTGSNAETGNKQKKRIQLITSIVPAVMP